MMTLPGEGLCLDGPMDGQWLRHDADLFRCAVPASVEHVQISMGSEAYSMSDIETFEYVPMVGLRGSFDIDFWVPMNRQNDIAWALGRIVRHYCDTRRRV